MVTHNWWHQALFALELDRADEVLALYDRQVWGVAKEYSQDQINAVSLLARLELAGSDVGPRWQELGGFLAQRTADHVLPFLNLQYLLGLARAGRPEADTLWRNLQAHAATVPEHDQATWQDVCLPAAQGLLVLLLELPTGGLADALGRKPVLVLATGVNLASLLLLSFADSLGLLLAGFALQGIYRALDSGPLESWYVDALLAADPDADLERGLGHDRIGVNDNFFEIGGDSLRVVRVQTQLEKLLGRPIFPAKLFEHFTIRALAAHLAGDDKKTRQAIVPVSRPKGYDEGIAIIGMACRLPRE
jgi:hypothetical protein